jgi:hypothetical protein
MKKLLVAVAAICTAGALAGGVAANPDAGEVVARGFACGILDRDGNTVITTNSVLTQYQNKAVLRCQGDVGGTGPAVYWNFDNTGLSCGMLQFGSTNNWTNKVGYNGLSQLVCTQALGEQGDAAGGAAGLG